MSKKIKERKMRWTIIGPNGYTVWKENSRDNRKAPARYVTAERKLRELDKPMNPTYFELVGRLV